jgi:hypothetical protein
VAEQPLRLHEQADGRLLVAGQLFLAVLEVDTGAAKRRAADATILSCS